MREIKFRGKTEDDMIFEDGKILDKGTWVYGSLIVNGKLPYIVGEVVESDSEYIALEYWYPCDVNTIGQFTGLHDKNGKEIYIGDLLGIVDGEYIEPIEVVWDTEFSCVCYKQLGDEILPSFEFITKDYQVIGNIYDKGEVK